MKAIDKVYAVTKTGKVEKHTSFKIMRDGKTVEISRSAPMLQIGTGCFLKQNEARAKAKVVKTGISARNGHIKANRKLITHHGN